jgi:hypothetical protein
VSLAGWSTRGVESRWPPATEVRNDWSVLRAFELKDRRCYIVQVVRNHVIGVGTGERTEEWYTDFCGAIEGDPGEKVVAAYNRIKVEQDKDGWIWTRSLCDSRHKPKYPSRHESLVDVVESDIESVTRLLGTMPRGEKSQGDQQ